MSATQTIARKSILSPVLQSDGRSVLKEVGRGTAIRQGAASPAQLTVVKNVAQAGTSANAANAPTVFATVATATKNTYFVDLQSHGLSSLIPAANPEEAFEIFCSKFGIGASERDVLITEFLP